MNKINTESPASRAYLDVLAVGQETLLRSMEQAISRTITVGRSFQVAYNGMALKMTPAEARRIARLPGVTAVVPDRMRQLHTDNGPQWIGADDIWTGTFTSAIKGEGIVVGVIDTGINPANPSFADVGGDGYDHVNPRGRYYGFCDSGHADYRPAFLCNDKLIGAYDMTRVQPTPPVLYDNNGHGSHTASTAAGNLVNSVAIDAPTIVINRAVSGVAPHSNIISYKACLPSYCPLSALLAAIDQATTDGVDVINYSIGGTATDPWNDPDSEAFLNARQAGIFVATSAGNSGPASGTLGSPANSPWLLAVGNSSHNRTFANSLISLTRQDGTSLAAISGRSVTGTLAATGIVYAGDYGDPLCLNSFAPGTLSGKIVVCDRGTNARVAKGSNVLAGGASGFVLANDAGNGNSLNADAHVLPAVHITFNDGEALKSWLSSSTNHQAEIAGTAVDEDTANGDIMTASSSRGVNTPVPSIIKPDVSAPGLDILAANGINNAVSWGLMTGTSMASPHAAGAAALLLSLYPNWTPAEIQSALMSSADPTVLKEDKVTAAHAFDTGAGRIDVSRAARAGFILNVNHADYLAADPSLGGDPADINLPSLATADIINTTSWTRTLTSVSDTSWTATVTNPAGVSLSVDPASFSLPAGGNQVVTISANAATAVPDNWLFGSVVFTPASGDAVSAQFPVALKRIASTLPTSLRYDDVKRKASKTLTGLQSLEITDLTVTVDGLAAAETNEGDLYQDPTPSNPYDGNRDPDDPANKDGLWVQEVTVPAGTKRLVAEILATDSPDLDMYLLRWTGTWVLHCTSAGYTSDESCNIVDPVAGDYFIWIHNYQASDPGGATPDKVELGVAVVPDASAGNLTVALAGGGSSVPAGQTYDLKLSWSLPKTALHWYGRFGLGTDPANPDNLGGVDLDLHLKQGGMFFPVKGKGGKTAIIQLN